MPIPFLVQFNNQVFDEEEKDFVPSLEIQSDTLGTIDDIHLFTIGFSDVKGKEIMNIPLQLDINRQRYNNLKTMKKFKIQLQPAMVIGTRIVVGN